MWIETSQEQYHRTDTNSHTSCRCVDWNVTDQMLSRSDNVTPHVGVWIETFPPATTHSALPVTPHVGVWIETRYFPAVYTVSSVTPHVGVWIETWLSRCLDFRRFVTPHVGVWIETYRINPSSYYNRHTSCRCVDWNLIVRWQICIMLVTPHVGVWIETNRWWNMQAPLTSHLM